MQSPPTSVNSDPATKADLHALKTDFRDLKSDVGEMKAEFKSDVRDLKSDVDARFTRAENQLSALQVEVARISGQMPHMATAESVAKVEGRLVGLESKMDAGFAEMRALFAERVVPLEEHKRKSESRYRYLMGVVGAVAVGFVVTAWKVFIGA